MDRKKLMLSRRSLIKAAGLLGAGAALPACSSGDSSDFHADANPRDELVMDKSITYKWSTGPHNCGMRCVHKLHINKFNRVVALTSAGDLPRNDPASKESDESVRDAQKRACVRGYSYIKRQYQPDRLKYPLIQTKERGNPSGFKRISWDEALDYVAGRIKAARDRAIADNLGYLPIKAFWDVVSLFKKDSTTGKYPLGMPAMAVYGNASFGNIAAALWDSVGYDSPYNASVDMLNSNFIIVWSVDATSSFGHQGPSYWYYNKAKEAGVPIVVIDVKYSDTAATFGTGVNYTGRLIDKSTGLEEDGKSVDVPGWICIRPGTDIAMTTAMAYVIYKGTRNGIPGDMLDHDFLNKHVFGWDAGDTVTASLSANFMLTTPVENMTWAEMLSLGAGNYFEPNSGYPYSAYIPPITVPIGQSFSEFLDNLPNEPYVTAASANSNPFLRVLEWAERMTGVKADIIEALARHYATVPAARLDGGGGPQREFNGMYYAWMNIALAAMTGNSNRKGGGPGFSMFNEAGVYNHNHAYLICSGNRLPPNDQVLVSIDKAADLVFKKRDGRSKAQIAADMAGFHGITNPSGEIQVDMFINCANHLSSMPNVNKLMLAMTEKDNGGNYLLKDIIVAEQFMTPTAMFADIVLPAATHWEKLAIGIVSQPDLFFMDKVQEPPYETKTDAVIWAEVAAKLEEKGVALEVPVVASDEEAGQKGFYDSILKQIPLHYMAKYPGTQMPSWEEFKKMGHFNLPIDQDKAFIGLKDIHPLGDRSTGTPGRIGTTTGVINLWSPFYGMLRYGRIWDANDENTLPAGPRYIPNPEGYESILGGANTGKRFGGTAVYPLQLLTDKPKNRAHTVFDNVPVIKERFPQTCRINPVDAHERGIKEGDMIYIYNDRGCTKIPAQITDRTPPGVVRIQHGSWYRPHPGEKVTIWQDTGEDYTTTPPTRRYRKYDVPVDVGGCENILTLDIQNGPRDPYIGGSIYVQGCLVDVSLNKPELE